MLDIIKFKFLDEAPLTLNTSDGTCTFKMYREGFTETSKISKAYRCTNIKGKKGFMIEIGKHLPFVTYLENTDDGKYQIYVAAVMTYYIEKEEIPVEELASYIMIHELTL